MTRAKPAYDTDGSWKYRQFSTAEWDALSKRLKATLRPLYPDRSATDEPTFGHPADEWSSWLLEESSSAISMTLWLNRRRTNEE